jgi:hypothetical protein
LVAFNSVNILSLKGQSRYGIYKRNMRIVIIIISILWVNVVFGQNIHRTKSNDSIGRMFIDDTENYVYFPGGDSALMKFLSNNLKFPDSCSNPGNSVLGKVIVSFIIDEGGIVSDIGIYKGLNDCINNEIARVISIMPKWEWDNSIDISRRTKCTKMLPVNIN